MNTSSWLGNSWSEYWYSLKPGARRRRMKRRNGASPSTAIQLTLPASGVIVPPSFGYPVWYMIIVSSAGTLQADTDASPIEVDTKMGIYGLDGLLIAENNDSNTVPEKAYLSKITVPVTAGTYFIVVGFHTMQLNPNFGATRVPAYNNIGLDTPILLTVTLT